MSTQSVTGDIKKHFTWSIFTGILTALLGLFLITFPLVAAAITTVVFGSVLICVGVVHFIFAFHSHSIGKFLLQAISSVLYVIAGIALAFFPLAGVAALTVLLGAFLLVYAGVVTVTAFQLRPYDGWGWFLVDGIASFLMGALILAGWPSSSIWAIGTLVGVSVLMGGISRIMIATRMRRTIDRFESGIRKAA